MPPKKTTGKVASKPAPAKTGAAKTGAAKPGAAKAGAAKAGGAKPAGGVKAPAGGAAAAALAKEPVKPPVKRDSMDVTLKQLKPIVVEQPENEIVRSGKLPLVIDPETRSLTLFRYSEGTAVIEALDASGTKPETLRVALMYALRHGTTIVIDMGENDVIGTVKERWDALEAGLWKKIMDRTINHPENFKSLIRESDGEHMGNEYMFLDETCAKFRCILFTSNMEPSDYLRDNFFNVYVKYD